MIKISVLGSTGSIGTQALEVIAEHPQLFSVEVLTACRNADLLINQARRFVPDTVVIADEQFYHKVSEALSSLPIKVYAGSEALEQVASYSSVDLVLVALVGYSGLIPTIRAIEAKRRIALANKETLVVAGKLVMSLAASHKVPIIPVDSEHSAIFQCLAGEYASIDKLYLTASGGPFLHTIVQDLAKVNRQQALAHPRWNMGAKITVDSATMMNKGFEVIEAHHLFGVAADKIEVLVHPQSIIHSMVQFDDGAIKAQLGEPDMRIPIQYSFTYPHRAKTSSPRIEWATYPTLSFMKPDANKFRCLVIAYEALRRGGNTPCVVNAANEVAVEAFLSDRIAFTDIARIIESVMERTSFIEEPSLDDCIASNIEAVRIASEIIQ
ncbi:MAG: 1-deoxy-D-xylulose-5-phosphate reductoisomerase [Prevotellaceae bacterium]|jgi:1-deoxy-D-xylulose-5-phosphate reductoisomerase|nr:1-deoxy-D-xylulose-5-phosphate reductoisomerase [Prevotellaceae bacterium]